MLAMYTTNTTVARVTLSTIEHLFTANIGISIFKNFNSQLLNITSASVNLYDAQFGKRREDFIGKSETEVYSNLDYLALFHEHDKLSQADGVWTGIEPCFWKEEPTFAMVQKIPVYDNKQNDIIGTLADAFIINQDALLNSIRQLTGYQKVLTNKKIITSEIYQQDKKYHLSLRESECLFYTLLGQRAKEIGIILKISPKTVEFHLENLKAKFNCRSKVELIAKAIDAGYLEKIPVSCLKSIPKALEPIKVFE